MTDTKKKLVPTRLYLSGRSFFCAKKKKKNIYIAKHVHKWETQICSYEKKHGRES
jgi:hypothetical protein